jgi:hypothetical protein
MILVHFLVMFAQSLWLLADRQPEPGKATELREHLCKNRSPARPRAQASGFG